MRILLAFILGALLSTCSSPPSLLERIVRSGELRVVTRNTPAAFYYGAEEPRGIEYELARGYAERLGVGLRIYVNDQVFPDVVSGKAQIGAASLTIADSRLPTVNFGPAYQKIQPEIIYRRGTKTAACDRGPSGRAARSSGQLVARRHCSRSCALECRC